MKTMFKKLLWKKRHKSQWKQNGFVKDSGIFSQVDVDKNSDTVSPNNLETIIVGKKNVCLYPCIEYICEKCNRTIIISPNFFGSKLDLPKYCEE